MNQPPTPTTTPAQRRRSRLRAALSIAAMLAVSVWLLRFDFAALGGYGYLGVFGLMLVGNATVFVPAPAFVVAFSAGQTLNPWLVGLVSGLGAGLGETTGYFVGVQGRKAADDQGRLARILAFMRRWGALAVFLLAALPNPLMDVAGIAAGLLRMPFWKYLLACCAGKTIRFTLLALTGYGLT